MRKNPPMAAIHGPEPNGSPVRTIHLETATSTNDVAKAAIKAGEASGPTVWIAARQTAGRGRLGRRWESPEGGLWLTMACPASYRGGSQGLGIRAGVAVCDVVRAVVGGRAALKWPNDVLIDSRKVAGVLCETVSDPAESSWLIVGVGINANNDPGELAPGLRTAPASLRGESGRVVDLGVLARDVVDALDRALAWSDRESARRASELLHGRGEPISLVGPSGTRVSGILRGVASDGLLVVESDGELKTAPINAQTE